MNNEVEKTKSPKIIDVELEECDECGVLAVLESLAYGALDVNLCPRCHAKSWAEHPENNS